MDDEVVEAGEAVPAEAGEAEDVDADVYDPIQGEMCIPPFRAGKNACYSRVPSTPTTSTILSDRPPDSSPHDTSTLTSDDATPKLLARFRVNQTDVLSVFKAISKEDFQDVVGLLPQGTPLPASDKMTYLLARLEVRPGKGTSAVASIMSDHESWGSGH